MGPYLFTTAGVAVTYRRRRRQIVEEPKPVPGGATSAWNPKFDYGIPTDLEAVKVRSSAPVVLDLSTWLTYRCFVAKGPDAIPISGPCGLVSQIGSVE